MGVGGTEGLAPQIIAEVDLPQRSRAWFDARRGCVGTATEAAIIACDFPPFEDYPKSWQEHRDTKGEPRDLPEAALEAIAWGVKYEPEALDWWNRQARYARGAVWEPVCAKREIAPGVTIWASLDACAEINGQNESLEIKCPHGARDGYLWRQLRRSRIPSNYYWQMMSQALTLDTLDVWMLGYIPKSERTNKSGWAVLKPPRQEVAVETGFLSMLWQMFSADMEQPTAEELLGIHKAARHMSAGVDRIS